MAKKKKLKLKRGVIIFLEIIASILIVILSLYMYYYFQINSIMKLGYSKIASKNIYSLKQKDYIETIGYNETLEKAFESKYYKEEYLKDYSKIEYQNQKDLIKNINKLLDKKYSVKEISLILKKGNNKEVSSFTKLDKQRYIEEFLSVEFSKLSNFQRYVKYSMESGESDEDCVIYVNLDLDKDVYTDYNEVSEFSFTMLVNKHNKLSDDFVASDLVKVPAKYAKSDDMKLNETVLNQFIKMFNQAESENKDLVINSAYRAHSDQEELYNTYLGLYGEDYVKKYVATPGFSEHETGLCFDIGSKNSSLFIKSSEYEWMQQNAYKYGFILRFPEWGETLTQFKSEAWHYRYVGVEIATYLHENIMTYEEYYARFIDK